MFNPKVYADRERLRQGLMGSFVVVEDALELQMAEQLYSDLTQAKEWEKESIVQSHFVYQRDKIDLGDRDAPGSVKQLYEFLRNPDTLRWIKEISGRDCDNFNGAAAIFNPGDHISEHNDKYIYDLGDRRAVRLVTFTYYLTRHWDEHWGGRLVWKKPYAEIIPKFNTMVLFVVGSDSAHWVDPVSPSALEKRLSITGWFLRTLPKVGEKRRLQLK